VVVIGGSSGIGLETARLARAHYADVIVTARNAERLQEAAEQVSASSTAAFDATNDADFGTHRGAAGARRKAGARAGQQLLSNRGATR
jgi:NADP-dependent 3-hydroxy acid dehydrogenase YdfG